MIKRVFVLATMCVPTLALAANVFVWNYDPLDKFYEPAVLDSVDCAYWVEQTLDICGHTYVTDTLLPSDLTGYDVVYALLGWFRC